MPFRTLAHADIADRGRHQNSFAAFQRAEHDLDRKFGAILAPPGEFNPGADPLRQCVLGGPETIRDQPLREALWNDIGYFLPKKFVAAISELFLRLQVQQDDLPTLVDHHHRIGSRLEQPAIPGLHPRQMLFRLLADADVADRRRHQNSFGASQRTQHDLDRKFGAIPAPPDELDPGADLLRQCVLGGPKTVSDQPLREALRNNVGHLLTKELVTAISELLLRLEVQQDDLPALVDHHHRIGSRLEHFLEFLLSLVTLVRRRPEFVAAALALRKLLLHRAAYDKHGDHREHDDESESEKIDRKQPNVRRCGIRGPKRDQALLLIHRTERRNADSRHEIETQACAHKGQGRSMVAGIIQAHGLPQLVEFAQHQRLDLGNRASLHRAAGGRASYVGERGDARVDRIAVNFKVAGVAGEEIAALFALGDANDGHGFPEPVFELQRTVRRIPAGLRGDDEVDRGSADDDQQTASQQERPRQLAPQIARACHGSLNNWRWSHHGVTEFSLSAMRTRSAAFLAPNFRI